MGVREHRLEINTGPVALIFEGGGMRNAYTAAVLATLIRENINFPKAYGVSAGAELAVDYVARDVLRARTIFTEASTLPEAGGVWTFLTGRGFYNTSFVFGELGKVAEREHHKGPAAQAQAMSEQQRIVRNLWFDMGTFLINPADVQIEALDLDDGSTADWTKTSMETLDEVMVRVAASCSYPVFTPEVRIDGCTYIDGGMGSSHGVCLEAARRDGFERFFIVRTRPRGFRLSELNAGKKLLYKVAYAGHHEAYQALLDRPDLYNAQLDEIDRLEREGKAYQFCPTEMPVTYTTGDAAKLKVAYEMGLEQSRDELPRWKEWLATTPST